MKKVQFHVEWSICASWKLSQTYISHFKYNVLAAFTRTKMFSFSVIRAKSQITWMFRRQCLFLFLYAIVIERFDCNSAWLHYITCIGVNLLTFNSFLILMMIWKYKQWRQRVCWTDTAQIGFNFMYLCSNFVWTVEKRNAQIMARSNWCVVAFIANFSMAFYWATTGLSSTSKENG